ncbi:MAG TPA: hypothetical protein PLV52_03045 [Candidatus Omnitrophota bacterium]|nr:hypothetical protein [Candidatus Omnitrophota bacterium]
MGKYASVIIGAIVAVLGLLGFIRWWGNFMVVVKGTLPAMLIFGGAIAAVAGLSELKDEQKAKKETQEEKK